MSNEPLKFNQLSKQECVFFAKTCSAFNEPISKKTLANTAASFNIFMRTEKFISPFAENEKNNNPTVSPPTRRGSSSN